MNLRTVNLHPSTSSRHRLSWQRWSNDTQSSRIKSFSHATPLEVWACPQSISCWNEGDIKQDWNNAIQKWVVRGGKWGGNQGDFKILKAFIKDWSSNTGTILRRCIERSRWYSCTSICPYKHFCGFQQKWLLNISTYITDQCKHIDKHIHIPPLVPT